jgi:hypothetical protein
MILGFQVAFSGVRNDFRRGETPRQAPTSFTQPVRGK